MQQQESLRSLNNSCPACRSFFPAPVIDLDDFQLLQTCVRELKVSARGIDAISSLELHRLPPLAITHVKTLSGLTVLCMAAAVVCQRFSPE